VTALRAIRRRLGSPFVFVNPDSGEPWKDIKKAFARACREAGLEAIRFHDLGRSFVTKARRAGIPESVVMRFSGHRTRAVFDRYNVVDESDAVEAIGRLEAAAGPAGRVLDEVGEGGAEDAKAPRS
jgi:integrase